jgi:nicotinamide mononucleotide adenylyltransferase
MLPAILLIGGSIAAISTSEKNEVEEQKKSGAVRFSGTLTEFPKAYKIPSQKLKVGVDPSKTQVILVACGSFSPITIMHLRLLEMCKDYFDSNGFEVVGGYISPVGDAYQKKGLVNAIDRTNMAILATQDSDWIMVDTWEAAKPSWCRTVEVLDHFSGEINGLKKYKEKVQVIFVCGSDLLDSFCTPGLWADEDVQRICDHGLAVVTREGSDPSSSIWKNDLLYINRTKIHKIHQWIPNDISSTLVRLGISRGLSIRYLLPNLVLEYIKEKGLYREEVEEDKFSK